MKKLNLWMQNSLLTSLLKWTRSTFVTLSVWTMVFSPVAYGAQAAKQFDQITQNELKELVISLGLNKKMTYKEFWDKTKHLYPTRVHKDVEATLLSQPSAIMPKFDVTFTQDSKGRKVPTLKITDRGNTTNVQIIGELNEWARVNGVSLSESDLKQIRPALEKLNPSAIQLETYKKDFSRFSGFPRMTPELWKSLKPEDRARYIVEMRLLWFEARRVIEANAPSARVTPQVNPRQKKQLINPKQKGKKTSAADEFLQYFMGFEANAGIVIPGVPASGEAARLPAPPPPAPGPANAPAPGSPVAPAAASGAGPANIPAPATAQERQDIINLFANDGKSNFADEVRKVLADPGYGGKACQKEVLGSGGGCVVAGQVAPADGSYHQSINSNSAGGTEPRCACNYHSVLVQRYLEIKKDGNEDTAGKYLLEQASFNRRCDEINKAQQGGIWVACNPMIYSFDKKSGEPLCLNTREASFQQATAYSATGGKSCDQISGRLGPAPEAFGNLNILEKSGRAAALKIIDESQAKEGYQQTKDYLEGMVRAKAKNLIGDKSFTDLLDKADYTQALDDFFVDTQKQFEKEINRAMTLCVSNSPTKLAVKKNQDLGCEQLHRKWLFTEKILEKYRSRGCLDGSTYAGEISKDDKEDLKAEKASLNRNKVGDAKLCTCKDGSKVGLGKKCEVPNPPPPRAEVQCPGTSSVDPDNDKVCLCPGGSDYFDLTSDSNKNAEVYINKCHPREAQDQCDKYGQVANMDPATCLCLAGSREGQLPSIGKAPVYDRSVKCEKSTTTGETSTDWNEKCTVPNAATQVSGAEYTCDEKGFNWLKWLGIGALGIGALYLLFKKKKDNPPNYVCQEGPNFRYNQQLGVCYCPLVQTCPGGLVNADCSACAPVPVCVAPKSKGTPPACSCSNTCLVGVNHPVTCLCEEGGNDNVNPDGNGGGFGPVNPVGR